MVLLECGAWQGDWVVLLEDGGGRKFEKVLPSRYPTGHFRHCVAPATHFIESYPARNACLRLRLCVRARGILVTGVFDARGGRFCVVFVLFLVYNKQYFGSDFVENCVENYMGNYIKNFVVKGR